MPLHLTRQISGNSCTHFTSGSLWRFLYVFPLTDVRDRFVSLRHFSRSFSRFVRRILLMQYSDSCPQSVRRRSICVIASFSSIPSCSCLPPSCGKTGNGVFPTHAQHYNSWYGIREWNNNCSIKLSRYTVIQLKLPVIRRRNSSPWLDVANRSSLALSSGNAGVYYSCLTCTFWATRFKFSIHYIIASGDRFTNAGASLLMSFARRGIRAYN